MRAWVDMLLKTVITTIFVVLVACVSWQVISRYVLGTPSTVTDELARFLFMWLALIGGAYTLGLRRHLAIDLLTQQLSGRARTVSEAFVLFAIAVGVLVAERNKHVIKLIDVLRLLQP